MTPTSLHHRQHTTPSVMALFILIVAALFLFLPDIAFGATYARRNTYDKIERVDAWRYGNDDDRWNDTRRRDDDRTRRDDRDGRKPDRRIDDPWDDRRRSIPREPVEGELSVVVGQTFSIRFVGTYEQTRDADVDYDRNMLFLANSTRNGNGRNYMFTALRRGTTTLTYHANRIGEQYLYRISIH